MNILTSFLLLTTLTLTSSQTLAFGDSLADIHENLKERYNIEHISNDQFTQMAPSDTVVFDVRKPVEYAVSHIDGAIRVDPGIKPEDFFSQYGKRLNGKTSVFYCSVGRRSSKLLSEVNDQLPDYGAKNAYNLEGGIFKWHNDQIDLVRNEKSTRDVHPYNLYWSRLLENRSFIEYSVESDVESN